ncbi:MAG: hypothetical protein JNK32_03590 [Anaerolineales bacterium]|nr:hypothetical protein [Anaerolineales bacterium]
MKISIRNGGIAGIVAGLGYIVQAIMGLIKPQTEVFSGTSDYILEVVFIVALAATIAALMGLHTFAQSRYGKAGMVGFWLAIIGTGLITISAMATLFAGQNSLGPVFLGGMLLSLIGYIVLGITTLRSKSLPLWGGLALIFGFPLSVFLSAFGGGILFGLAWLGVGYYLMKQ